MSFSSDVKAELAAKEIKPYCCRNALLLGILCGCSDKDGASIAFETSSVATAEFLSNLCEAVYKSRPERSGKNTRGKTVYSIIITGKKPVSQVRRMSDGISDGACITDVLPKNSCPSCVLHFLRGVFIAYGTLTDPHKGYHAEMLLPDAKSAALVSAAFGENGLAPKSIRRGGEKGDSIGLYYKSSDSIGELLGFLGADKSMFEFINVKIENEFRNNANRSANFETVNIEKTVSAAQAQIAAINAIMEAGVFDLLPPELRTTALLRLQYDESTLAELADLHEPKLSKSGLNHRLRKLMEEAEGLGKK